MSTGNKQGLLRSIQSFMGSYRGKVILNYAYSWGAAIVILGALFKLTHMPGANLMLWIGMGTEVLVFFISAFDLPARPSGAITATVAVQQQTSAPVQQSAAVGVSGKHGNVAPVHEQATFQPITSPSVSPEMEEATNAYLVQLREMTDTLARFTGQAEVLSQDAEQINLLNRNLAGINAIYEMQLRSASSQIGTIDQVHEQTRKMARQIEELNAVYARMLDAMNGNTR